MRSTKPIRADIPTDVWDRLADEATAAGVPLGRYLRNLIVRRDEKRHGKPPGASTSTRK